MKVPFLELGTQYGSLREEIAEALQRVLDATAFAGGPFVRRFEENFASFCHAQHAVGVGSGTEALWLSLLALDIGAGDEVITVPNTFVATVEAICFTGATPVLVDVDDKTYTMDPSRIEAAITPKTKAIIPVHLFGQTADMDPICALAQAHGLAVIEDACQAHGATYKGKPAGSLGDAGCFSFYPGKNLGAYGEGGAVTTDNAHVAERIRRLRDHGQPKKYHHSVIGWNARMDGFQGAILDVKLKHLSRWNELRREHAKQYTELLGGIEILRTPAEADYGAHVYHIYAVRVGDRDALMQALLAKDIHCGIHYPIPVHRQEAFSALPLARQSFPVAETCANEFLSLPLYPELTPEAVTYVAGEIKHFAAAVTNTHRATV